MDQEGREPGGDPQHDRRLTSTRNNILRGLRGQRSSSQSDVLGKVPRQTTGQVEIRTVQGSQV